jgi:hypothetical protein
MIFFIPQTTDVESGGLQNWNMDIMIFCNSVVEINMKNTNINIVHPMGIIMSISDYKAYIKNCLFVVADSPHPLSLFQILSASEACKAV